MAKPIKLMSTAYGAPWGGIQGTGTTATGVDLVKNPKQYVVAVDPKVIPLGSKLKIADNPFGDPNIVFTAADTGGAIKGNRLDFYDWRGRKSQMNWGTRPISAEIVGAGDPSKPAGADQGAADGTGATYLPGTSPSAFSGQGGGADLSTLIQSLMQPTRMVGPAGAVPTPRFAAAAPMPAGYQPIQSAGGPAPPSDVGNVIRQLLPALAGAPMPQSSAPGVVIPGSSSSSGGTSAPLKGAIVGSPVAGAKPHPATHETLGLPGYPAYDYMAKAGTPVVAPVTGKIIKLSGSDPRNGPSQGPHGPFGYSIYVQGDDGSTYFLTHLGSRNVKVGQRVRQGAAIGTIGDYAKWGGADHVHAGVKR